MNKSTRLFVFFVAGFMLWVLPLFMAAQEKAAADSSMKNIENYREQIRRLMGFLEFSLNTLGDPETVTREKEVIINESYLKAFMNDKVQIEDDLDENREILTYKDVQAYLKDVDFFFKEAEFSFDVKDIQSLKNDQGMTYFKVTANRNLKAITVSDSVVSNDKTRYVEINLDDEEQVLKIASIYTTRLNEAQELISWWNGMPVAWKKILGSTYTVNDSISLDQIDILNDTVVLRIHEITEVKEYDSFIMIGEDSLLVNVYDTVSVEKYDTLLIGRNNCVAMLKDITKMESLEVPNASLLTDLYPVDQMSDLKKLNISNTGIIDLFPARNLNKLESLNISGTGITDLSPIRYSSRIRELYLDNTPVDSLAPIQDFSSLEILHMSNSAVYELNAIKRLANLKDLRFDNTRIADMAAPGDLIALENLSLAGTDVSKLDDIQYLVTLTRINFENTKIDDLSPLSRLENLQYIDADLTPVSNLEPLGNLPRLEKVYCDQTLVTASIANAFMAAHPQVLVIYESVALSEWWSSISPDWQTVFRQYAQLDPVPATEQLHQLTLINKIDISNNQNILGLEPLSKLGNLKEVYATGTLIGDMGPLKDLIDLRIIHCGGTRTGSLLPLQALTKLEELDFSNTLIESCEGLENLGHLKKLQIEGTAVNDLTPLETCDDLQIIYCDNTKIGKLDIDRFLDKNPDCLIIYQTILLKNWWEKLPVTWQAAFRSHTQLDDPPTREQLHTLAALTAISIAGNRSITSLAPLTTLHRLEDLDLANGTFTDLTPLSGLIRLQKLNLSGNPAEDISPISNLPGLIHLDISNTPISKLDPLQSLRTLQSLNCSGTQIKKLDPLADLTGLQKLECYNTAVNNLKPLLGLVKLKSLVCYNTKLNQKKVDAFKEVMPGLEVVYY